ncbi:MAG: hypothetical protein ISS84_00760 [Candidatus Pacebacteria bacterium]|nr:hypothetical protein [Candidatus Paceibacterota bacterium]
MNPNKKIIFTSGILGIISLIFIFLIIYPLFNNIKKNSEVLISQKKELASLEGEIENLKNFEKIYQAHHQNLEKIDKLFIDPEIPTDIIKFVGFLRKIAEDSQIPIDISSPTPKKEIAADPWPSITFQVSCEGKFSNFGKFLEKIETGPYLIEILNLNTRRLTEKELKPKEFEEFSLADSSISLSIKVFTSR